MPVHLTFHAEAAALPTTDSLVLLGRRERLRAPDITALLPSDLPAETWLAMLGKGDPGDDGRVQATWVASPSPRRVLAAVLPEVCSRHNTPSRAWAVPRLLAAVNTRKDTVVVIAVDDDDHAGALALALGRSFPAYDARSGLGEATVHVLVLPPEGSTVDLRAFEVLAQATRQAAALVDRPPNDLGVSALVQEAREIALSHPGVRFEVIEGEALREGGFGGLWGVGKAASDPPAMVVLEHLPEGATQHDAWVGKGIVYDTGGLSLKTKTGMPGMKSDMGGAAAVLHAFDAAVTLGATRRITAVLCLAENAVGPAATRPDDVLTMYSGRTVEVNNTDAEGRLVLADGVAWVTRHRRIDRLIDVATLTGAQLIATGKRHAAIVCNDDELEDQAVAAGQLSGDLVHPLPFCPEFLLREFRSPVADLRNSVKDRSNAQSSCAAEFIRQHVADTATPWLHVDIAGPAVSGGRGTGFGVGLLLALLGPLP